MKIQIPLRLTSSCYTRAPFRSRFRSLGIAVLSALLAARAFAQTGATVWPSSSSFTGSVHSLGTGNTGYVTTDFDVTPATAAINGVIGYAGTSVKISGYPSSALAVRLNTTNTFDVRNGANYAALVAVPYVPKSTYHVKVAVDFADKLYSVWITPPGGLATQIAADYAFRPDAPATSDLGQIGLVSPSNSQFSVANHAVQVAPPAPAATMLFHDGFESNNFTAGGWTNNGATVQTSVRYAGTHAALFNKSASISKNVTTEGWTGIQVSYARDVIPTSSTTHFIAEWYNGSIWQTLEDVTAKSGWTVRTFVLSPESVDNPSFALRFRVSGYGSSDYAYVDEVTVTSAGQNVALNGGFEMGSLADWYPTAWAQTSTYACESGTGLGGTHCASIQSLAANDAALCQDLQLTPGEAYDVSAWIKGDSITVVNSESDEAIGANLCQFNTWSYSSDNLVGTFPWTQEKLTIFAPADGSKVTIGARLGYWDSTDTGKAWFDNIVVAPMGNRRESSHFIFDLERADTAAFTSTNYDRWLAHLDNVYFEYADLVGGVPYGGAKIGVLSTYQYCGGWAVDGNPIQWTEAYVSGELATCNAGDNWSFGIMHEIGHDFDIGGWNWAPEFFANFKMYHGVEVLNANVFMNNVWYVGPQLATYYETDSPASYSKTIAQGQFSYDALIYCFIRIKNQIGWAPFKSTFRYYLSSGAAPARHIDNFNLFLDKLTAYSGYDVRSTFLPGELQTCVNAISAEN